jgi:hypothetical protein
MFKPLFFRDDSTALSSALTLKKQATAEEIHTDLVERIERRIARDPRFAGCAAPWPKAVASRREGAPNWTIDGFPGGLAPGCFTELVKLVDQARMEYDLVD